MSFNKKFLNKSPFSTHHTGEAKWKQQKASYDKYQNQLSRYKADSTSYVDNLKKFENFQLSKTKYPGYYGEGAEKRRKKYDDAINYIKDQSKKGNINPKINYDLLHKYGSNVDSGPDQETMLKNFFKTYVAKPTEPVRPVEVKNPGDTYKTKPKPGERVYKEYSYIGPSSFSIDPVTREKTIKRQTAKSLMSK